MGANDMTRIEPIGDNTYALGDYVVTTRYSMGKRRVWLVFTRQVFEQYPFIKYLSIFETMNKREALKHARELERERLAILAAMENTQ
jgi:hypothetical protein